MPAAVRGRGLLVAVGFPTAAVFVLAMWLALQGGADMTVLPAAAVLVVLAGLAEQITIVVTPRIHISVAFGFVVAAALIGGPLVGACAGASAPLLEKGAVWRKRVAWGGADALSGFAIGILGQQVVLPGGAGALALAAVALLTGLLLNSLNMGIVALDRSGAWWPEFSRSWPSHLLAAALPWAPLAAFLFTYHLAPRSRWLWPVACCLPSGSATASGSASNNAWPRNACAPDWTPSLSWPSGFGGSSPISPSPLQANCSPSPVRSEPPALTSSGGQKHRSKRQAGSCERRSRDATLSKWRPTRLLQPPVQGRR